MLLHINTSQDVQQVQKANPANILQHALYAAK